MNWQEYLVNYKKSHLHPINRVLHAFGIPMIVLSLPLFIFSWPWAIALFVLGWILQFVGHAIEGKPPAFFKNPAYLVVGPYWWIKKHLNRKSSGESIP